jgi:hypothetical protein
MPAVPYEELFKGYRIFSGGKVEEQASSIEAAEEKAVLDCLSDVNVVLSKVSPTLADLMTAHKQFFLSCAKIAKSKMDDKVISYPGQPGMIGVSPIVPQLLKWSGTVPTDYPNNSWELSLTAGTPVYLLGGSATTAWYKTSSTVGQRMLLAIPKDGIVEIGSTPKLDQFRLISESLTKFGPWGVCPLIELQADPDRPIYQYPTQGAFYVTYDLGYKLYAMPKVTGKSKVIILGLAFYEHELVPEPKWVS